MEMQIKTTTLALALPKRVDSCDFPCRLTIALLPFVLLAINNNWIFCKPRFIDRWIYSGFHLHLPEFLKAFGSTYYASRVPWTVSGWLLHAVFDDVPALYILHFGVFYLAAFSLYVTVRTIYANTAAAAAAAVLLATNSNFLFASGWDYVDGPTIGCLLASLAALASTAIRQRWRLAAVLWGLASALLISIYILQIVFVPVEIGLFVLLNRRRNQRSVVTIAAWFAGGAAAGVLCLGLVNWMLGGPFLYFLSQIHSLGDVATIEFGQNMELSQWIWSARELLLPGIAFVFSSAYVCWRAKSMLKKACDGADPQALLFYCCLADVAACLTFIGLEAAHFNVLSDFYRADALLAFTYLPIGGVIAAATKSNGQVRSLGFLAAVVVITLAPWVLATFGYFFPNGEAFRGPTHEIGWISAGVLCLFIAERLHRTWGAALVVLLLSIVDLGAPSLGLNYPPNPAFKPEILAVFDASRQVARYDPNAEARFWFDANDPDSFLLRDVTSTYLSSYRLVNDQFPKLVTADGTQSSIAAGERIVLLTAKDDDPIPLANAAVADRHLAFEQVAKLKILHPGVALTMYVTDVESSDYEEITSQAFALELPTRIVTPAQPWAYGAQFPLHKKDLTGPVLLRVRADVHSGPIGMGILNRDGTDFLSRTSVTSAGETTVTLRLTKPEQLGDLVIQSWADGAPGNVTVESITVLAPRSSSAVQQRLSK